MFGHHDENDNKKLLSRLFSYGTFFATGVTAYNWAKKHGAVTQSSIFGYKYTHPSMKKSIREITESMSMYFPSMHIGRINPADMLDLNQLQQTWTKQALMDSDALKEPAIQEIKRRLKDINNVNSEYKNLVTKYIDTASNNIRSIDTSKAMPGFVASANSSASSILYNNTDNTEISNYLKNWVKKVEPYKDIDFTDNIYEEIRRKHPNVTKSDFTDVDKLETLSVDALKDIKKELQKQVYKTKHYIKYLESNVSNAKNINNATKNIYDAVSKTIDNIPTTMKYIDITPDAKTEVLNNSLTREASQYFKEGLKNFPNIDSISTGGFLKRFFGGKLTNVKKVLSESGYDDTFQPWMHKLKEAENLMRFSSNRFAYQLKRLTKGLIDMSKEGYGITNLDIFFSETTDSNKMILRVLTHKGGIKGSFDMPIVLDKGLGMQFDKASTTVMFSQDQTGASSPMKMGVDHHIKNLRNYFSKSVSTNKVERAFLQGNIDNEVRLLVPGVPKKGNLLEDFYKASRYKYTGIEAKNIVGLTDDEFLLVKTQDAISKQAMMKGFVSQEAYAKGLANTLNPDEILPTYPYSPVIGGGHQVLNAEKVMWRTSDKTRYKSGRHVLPFIKENSSDIWKRLKNNHYAVTWFLDPIMNDSETLVDENLMKSFSLPVSGRKPYRIDKLSEISTKAITPGKIIYPGELLGEFDGELQKHKGKFPILVTEVNKIGKEYRIKYDELVENGLGLKMHNFTRFRGIIGGTVKAHGLNIEGKHWYNIFKDVTNVGDPGSLWDVLVGQLRAWTDTNPENLNKVSKALNEVVDKNGNRLFKANIVDGRFLNTELLDMKGRVLGLGEDSVLSSSELIKKMFEVYKKVGLTQDKVFNEKYRVKNTLSVKYTEEEVGVMLERVKYYMRSKSGRKFIEELWLPDLGMTSAQISAVLKSNDNLAKKFVTEKIFENPNIPKFIEPLYNTVNGKKMLSAGTPYVSTSFVTSTMNVAGTFNDKIKIGRFAIEQLQFVEPAKKLYKTLNTELLKQSYGNIGKATTQMMVGTGQVEPSKLGGININEYIKDLLSGKESVNEVHAYNIFKKAKSPKEVIKSLKLYEDAEGILTTEDIINRTDELGSKIKEIDPSRLIGRVWKKDQINFLYNIRKRGSGYYKLPKPVKVKIAGGIQTWDTVKLMGLNLTEIGRNKTLGTGKFVVESEITKALHGLIATAEKDPTGRTWESYVQHYADLMQSEGSYKSLMKAHVEGTHALALWGKPFVGETKDFKSTYDKYSLLSHEISVSSNILGNKKQVKVLANSLESLTGDDLVGIEKYMRNYDEFMGGGTIKRHPILSTLDPRKTKEINDLLDEMKVANKLIDLRKVKKAYTKAVTEQIMPYPSSVIRYPGYMVPAMTFIRKENMKNSATGSIMRFGSFLAHILGGDTDGDQLDILMAPHESMAFLRGELEHRKGAYADLEFIGTTIVRDKKLPGSIDKSVSLVFDPKINGLRVVDDELANKIAFANVDKIQKEVFGPDALTRDQVAEMSNRIKWTKEGAPIATKNIYSYASLMQDHGKGWSTRSKRQIFESLDIAKEWVIKQKKSTGGHDPMLLKDLLESMNPIKMEQQISTEASLSEFKKTLLQKAPKDTLEGIKDWIPRDLKDKESVLAVVAALKAKGKNTLRGGNFRYRTLISGVSNVGEYLEKTRLGQYFQEELPPELVGATGVPFESYEKSMGSSIKKIIRNSMNKTTYKNTQLLGKTALGAVGVYLAFNFFNPNQTKYLGHVPGKGGEYHDWTFTKPEMDWNQILQTPIENLSDRPKTYIHMDNPMDMENLIRSKTRGRSYTKPITRRLTGISVDKPFTHS